MTVIIITHSRDMMAIAEQIVMLDQGQVVETGGYGELIKRRGEFYRLLMGGEWDAEERKIKRRSMQMMANSPGVETPVKDKRRSRVRRSASGNGEGSAATGQKARLNRWDE